MNQLEIVLGRHAGTGTALLVLLVAGHLLADFLTQTRWSIEAKRRGWGQRGHGVVVFLVQLVVVLPLLSAWVAAVTAAIAVVHEVVDRARIGLTRTRPASLPAFLLDQVVHLLVILGGWWILKAAGAVPPVRFISASELGAWVTVAVIAAALAFNATGGSVVVEGVLDFLPPGTDASAASPGDGAGEPADTGRPGAGRLIGVLERTLVLVLVVYGQWAAAVLLLTAKSIARFEELKVRRFAEYYLVGTLASLLVAVLTGLALRAVLGGF